jgi:hypothetical protein
MAGFTLDKFLRPTFLSTSAVAFQLDQLLRRVYLYGGAVPPTFQAACAILQGAILPVGWGVRVA